MPADLYCEIDGVQRGPLSVGQLKQLADDGVLQPSHSVWKSGMNRKVHASSIRGLFDEVPVEVAVAEEEDPAKERRAKKASPIREREEEVEEEEPEPELLAEVSVTYRDGLPGVEGPLLATLYVESTGLRFEFDNEDVAEYPISFEKIENVLEPSRGDFPPAMKKKALAAKVGGKVGKLAAGMFGQMIGGTTGDLVENVTDSASDMAERQGELGKTPRNRLILVARLRKERRKVRFDANGDSRVDMDAEAKALYRQIQKAWNRVSPRAAEDEPEEERIPLCEPLKADDRSAGLVPAATSSREDSKPFRVMSGGRVTGPYSLEELRMLFASGKIRADDMIGVETWLPFGTLSGMISSGGGSRSATQGSSTKSGIASVALRQGAPVSNDGAIPVDDEFKL